jgi:seryl-tRNA synthetase
MTREEAKQEIYKVFDSAFANYIITALETVSDRCEDKKHILNKIKAEIESLPKTYPFINHFDTYVKEDDVKRIIDKYKAESEDVE